MRERLTILVIVGTRTDEHSLRSQVGIGSESHWAAVSAGLSLVVLLAIEKPFMCISGHFEQLKLID